MGMVGRVSFGANIGVTVCLALLVVHLGGASGFTIGNICNPLLSARGPWINGQATFYDDHGRGGACGYGSLGSQLFGGRYAAGSPRVYLGGLACGMCFEVKCVRSTACKAGSVRVTITDLCPPRAPNSRWCGGGKLHLDMGRQAFPVIANPRAGAVPIQFRSIPCAPYKVLKLHLRGSRFWLEVTALAIPGSGRILKMEVAAAGGKWVAMKRAFGAAWAVTGQPMRTPISVKISIFELPSYNYCTRRPSGAADHKLLGSVSLN
ncbi:hypothetical protein CBR_g51021 [Chara braunii]|uniref:Expansin n=1 Tax=Chara braunii TaxID=69332 RepID=A0A388M856_CHABU|nr:hypothetical protein CBR_g51021 [Chara braunii]|eukprot:GBG90673.1 hypothetical protein CBR_g51021 [Chara braunii]